MQLAQVNVGRLVAPMDAPEVQEFIDALDPVNALADAAPGFLWRLSADDPETLSSAGDADDPRFVINLSTWTDFASLHAFTYRTLHAEFLRRRLEWFERLSTPVVALWWVEDGDHPSVAEARTRLDHLEANGPTPHAFTMRKRFDP